MLNAHKRQLVSLTVFLQAHTEMKSRHAGGRTAKEALASARHRTFVLVFSAFLANTFSGHLGIRVNY
jgi:hypothetical protein